MGLLCCFGSHGCLFSISVVIQVVPVLLCFGNQVNKTMATGRIDARAIGTWEMQARILSHPASLGLLNSLFDVHRVCPLSDTLRSMSMMCSLVAGWSPGQRSINRDRLGSAGAVSSFWWAVLLRCILQNGVFNSASGECSDPLGASEIRHLS